MAQQSIFELNSMFKDALKRVQFRMEAASKREVELFDKPWYEKYFPMGKYPHLKGDFNTVLGKSHITIAASTLNGRASEPLRMTEGYEELAQKMFYHGHAFKLTSDEILDMQDMAEIIRKTQGSEEAMNYIVNKIFDHTGEAINGVKARLDIIILSALSNEGVHKITKENDPQSPFVGKEMHFGLPDENSALADAGKVWYNAQTGVWNAALQDKETGLDPIEEIDSIVRPFRSKFKTQKILLDDATLRFILGMGKLKGYLNSLLYPSQPISIEMANNWLRDHDLPIFEVVRREVNIQDGDELHAITPWRTAQMVFLPEANRIGTIETKFSDRERGLISEGVTYANYGRIETRRMSYGEKEGGEYYELLKAGITAAPSFDTIDRILTFDGSKSSR